MTHLSQIFKSNYYTVLDSLKQMKGKTVIGVFNLKSDTGRIVIAFVNEGTILILDNGFVVSKEHILRPELDELESLTGIKESQLL